MASPRAGAREAQNYMNLSVAHKMTRNNTLNEVHVDATELPQLPQKERQPKKVAVRLGAALKLTGKKNC